MLRLFLGLPLPDIYQQNLSIIKNYWDNRLKSQLSWTKAGNWHLTLKFFGDVPLGQVPELIQTLSAVTEPSFFLQASGGGFFPARGAPRVVWVGVNKGNESSALLARSTEEVLGSLRVALDHRPFKAHLTLARVKFAKNDPWDELMQYLDEYPWPAVLVDRFILWQSTLRPQGPEYKVLAEFVLK